MASFFDIVIEKIMADLGIRNILVAYDFSQYAGNILHTAVALAREQHATLTILHVVEDAGVLSFGRMRRRWSGDAQIQHAKRKLETAVKSHALFDGFEYECIVCVGSGAHVIVQEAWNHRSDLIIMGKSMRSPITRLFIDTVSDSVIKKSSCPVLTVPHERVYTTFRKIVFPVRNAPLMLAKYDVVRPLVKDKMAAVLVTGLTRNDNRDNYRKVSFLVEALEGKLSHDGIPFVSRMDFCDNISARLLEITREESPDLLVISGTIHPHFRMSFPENYLNMILAKADCPILTVKPAHMSAA